MTTQDTDIPEGWHKTSLGKYIDIKHGYAFSGQFITDIENANVLLTPGNFLVGGGWKDGKKFYSGSDIPKDYILQNGDMVITMTDLSKDGDTLGYPAIIQNNPNVNYLHNQRIGLVQFTGEEINKDYLYWKLRTKEYQKTVVNSATGSTVRHTSPGRIKQYEFNIPDITEQKEIAAILSSFDSKIELLRKQNETLEKTAQTIFQEWFGKYSVDDELPEGWRVGKITEIIKREPVSYKCDKKDLDIDGTLPIIDQGANGLYGYTSRNADFLASSENPVIVFTNHTCNYWFVDYPFCAIQNVLPYRGRNGYDTYFLYFLTKGSITFIEYKGHWPDFEAKDFIIPPVELAREYSNIAKPILEKISSNKQQIQKLSKARDTLLPKLMKEGVNTFNS